MSKIKSAAFRTKIKLRRELDRLEQIIDEKELHPAVGIIMIIVGIILTVLGIALMILPGPGLLVTTAGMAGIFSGFRVFHEKNTLEDIDE